MKTTIAFALLISLALVACNKTADTKTGTTATSTPAPDPSHTGMEPPLTDSSGQVSSTPVSEVPPPEGTGGALPVVTSVEGSNILPQLNDEDPSEVYQGKLAPVFSWKASDGKDHSLKDYRGKIVVLNFWATWCPPCRAELPDLEKISQDLKDKDVVVLGMSVDRQEEMEGNVNLNTFLTDFMKTNNLTYPVIIADGSIQKAYGNSSGIPITFVIDKSGKVVKHLLGKGEESWFRSAIAAAK